MIITKIIGGLGNQMFQYAMGRALAIERSTELRVDIRDFDGYSLHNGFELTHVFNVVASVASDSDMHRVMGWRALPAVQRALQRNWLSFLRGSQVVMEPGFNYWPSVMKVPVDCYLAGYWQSASYFRRFEREIRADFTFKTPPDSRNQTLCERIAGCNAISLHIRRGDYVTNPATLATHGLCPPDYYRRAIGYIVERTVRPEFFVFSDDIEWVKARIPIEYPTHYIDHNRGKESYNDMRLMSHCRHHIIANSSFSWWGAWLNATPARIVVAPKKWFANGQSVPDLFPSEWVTL